MFRKTLVAFALAMALLPLTARSASAAPTCSEQYLLCLNDAYGLGSGEVECAAEWVGCVGRKLLFW